ncbi:MAG: F0F1 ATP synthase subunit A, partial [Planctomycetota bacterium]
MIGESLELAIASAALAAGDSGPNPVDHVVNHPFVGWAWSAHVGTLVLSGLIVCLGFKWVAGHVATGPESEGAARYTTKNPLAHMIEVICMYLRDKVVEPMLHERTSRFMPYLWTLFFFILVNNLLGLVPILDMMFILGEVLGLGWKKAHIAPVGGTATQNLAVTGVLAFFSFVVINAAGLRELGVKGYAAHLTGGAPKFIWPLMIPVEI